MGQCDWVQDNFRTKYSCLNQVRGLPNTSFSFPAPLITVSVARYWSPKACLPMHIGFVQPGKVVMLRYTHPSIYQEVIKYNFFNISTRNKARNVFAKNWFSEDSSWKFPNKQPIQKNIHCYNLLLISYQWAPRYINSLVFNI